MKNQTASIENAHHSSGGLHIPCMALAQFVYCWQCEHRGPYDTYEQQYRCGKDGAIEPSGGCSGAHDLSDPYDWDEPEEEDDDD